MPRIRYVKPDFFKNEQLGSLRPTARLLFVGLWCWADREGRLEDRPARLKTEILSYDRCNVDELLQQLAEKGFIQRYAADGKALIQVLNFAKHQRPHVNEVGSTYPAPTGYAPNTEQAQPRAHAAPTQHLLNPPGILMGNGERGLGSGDPPLPPAAAGETTRARRARNGSGRKRDRDALAQERHRRPTNLRCNRIVGKSSNGDCFQLGAPAALCCPSCRDLERQEATA